MQTRTDSVQKVSGGIWQSLVNLTKFFSQGAKRLQNEFYNLFSGIFLVVVSGHTQKIIKSKRSGIPKLCLEDEVKCDVILQISRYPEKKNESSPANIISNKNSNID